MATASRLVALFLCASAAMAQHVVGARAGTIQFTTGAVTVDGRPIRATETRFPVLKDHQTIATANGRVELLLAPGVFLRLGEESAVRMADTQLTDTQVVVLKGMSLVEVVKQTKGDRIQVRYRDTSTEFKGPGLYRFDMEPGRLRVFGGEAEVQAGSNRIEAGRGRQVRLRGELVTSKFNPNQKDDLHRWAARRSFELFASNKEARMQKVTHWEMTQTGWSWNRDFGMRFYSKLVIRDYEATHPPVEPVP